VGPSEDRASPSRKQAGRRPARPRARRCLLKGCEQWFQPAWPQARYCSSSCQEAAARWREWKARQRYRKTEGSRERRRAQSQRRRERQAERKRRAEEAGTSPRSLRVGHRPARNLRARATARAATRPSHVHADRRCSDSARDRAGVHWNACSSESAGGGNGGASSRRRVSGFGACERSVLPAIDAVA
jgi:hypothetical protein